MGEDGERWQQALSVSASNMAYCAMIAISAKFTMLLRSLFALLVLAVSADIAKAASPPPQKAPVKLNGPAPVQAAPSIFPADSEIQHILDDRVVTYHDTIGMVVGVIEPQGRRLFVRGPAETGNDDNVTGDTEFEIGSVTKVFTALLLADMAQRHELSLSDPVAKYLPPGTKLPQRGPNPITLFDLATHTSGLPKIPVNVLITDYDDPNADYTAEQLYRFLAGFELPRASGSGYEFSDAGYSLLGIALAKRGDIDLETLLRSRILDPLHMSNTRFAPSLAEKDRLAVGHDAHLQSTPSARLPDLPGSTGMRSTANDLLDFLSANLGFTKTPLAPAMASMIANPRPTGYTELKVGMGWHIVTLDGVKMVWVNGQTRGFRSFIGYAPDLHAGVVVLSNSANSIDDVGVHLLDSKAPLKVLHRESPIDQSLFDKYVGRYEVAGQFSLQITHDGNRFFIQVFGQPRAELFAKNNEEFFLRVVDGEVTFQTDPNGRAHSLILKQNGKTQIAQWIPGMP
jgi:CubicO group peptidase (beta-lactamase class C family)